MHTKYHSSSFFITKRRHSLHRYNTYTYPRDQTLMTDYLNNVQSGKVLLIAVRGRVKLSPDLAAALWRYGVSYSFTSLAVDNVHMSLAVVAHTGGIRKSWEDVIEKIGGIMIYYYLVVRSIDGKICYRDTYFTVKKICRWNGGAKKHILPITNQTGGIFNEPTTNRLNC